MFAEEVCSLAANKEATALEEDLEPYGGGGGLQGNPGGGEGFGQREEGKVEGGLFFYCVCVFVVAVFFLSFLYMDLFIFVCLLIYLAIHSLFHWFVYLFEY